MDVGHGLNGGVSAADVESSYNVTNYYDRLRKVRSMSRSAVRSDLETDQSESNISVYQLHDNRVKLNQVSAGVQLLRKPASFPFEKSPAVRQYLKQESRDLQLSLVTQIQHWHDKQQEE